MNEHIDITSLVEPCDMLLIVPPFSQLDRASLGVHVLQACARAAGFSVSVLYANLLFARWIGEHPYRSILMMPHPWLVGERLFARFAYDTPPLGHDQAAHVMEEYRKIIGEISVDDVAQTRTNAFRLEHGALFELERKAGLWLDALTPQLAHIAPAVVGATTMFEQTAPALALLRRVAAMRPEVTRIIGGANCEGEMAEGIHAIAPYVNHVFSGECEDALVDFLRAHAQGRLPEAPIVHGKPCTRLDDIPTPDYSEYYRQIEAWLPESTTFRKLTCIPYETSRGCWWGQKSHCTFCGLNGEGMGFREKSPERVLDDLRVMSSRYPSTLVTMADNIMPHKYYRSLLPRIRDELPPLNLFYELKSNLTLEHVRALAEAGIRSAQPGIESLSTGLLRLMAKGVSVSQNIAALRYARVFDISIRWNVLFGFPGDDLAFYRETLELMPLLRHLHTPSGDATPVAISRFSPYFFRPDDYGIRNMHAVQSYRDVLPQDAPLEKVAYYFDCDFPSASREKNDVIPAIQREIDAWVKAWSGPASERPVLHVSARGEGYDLTDTRGLGGPTVERIGAQQAEIALTGRLPADADASVYTWALARKVVVERDATYVPLAVADYALLHRMEQRRPSLRDQTRLAAGERAR